MAQRVPSKRSRAANNAIEARANELTMQGYPPRQAIAIALRQWYDDELIVIEPTDTTPQLEQATKQLDFAKTIGALTAFYKQRQKQINKERSKTTSRAERLKRYDDPE